MTPLVSVCIPTYNNPDGLAKTLLCITHQTYKNIHIIVSVNPSTDEETNMDYHALLKSFSDNDPRITCYYQATNIEVDGNYRFVTDHADGKYFMFAQDDDWWSPRYIEKLVLCLEMNPNAPVGACPSRYMIGQDVQSEIHNLDNISVYNAIGSGDMGFVCMGLWRKDAYLSCEVRLPVYVLGGDHITVAHAIMAYGNPVIYEKGRYMKGFKPGRFQVCFKNDFWYSFRSWYWMMKVLIQSNRIPTGRKLLLPGIAITNLFRASVITAIQAIVTLPEGSFLRRKVQQRFFGAN